MKFDAVILLDSIHDIMAAEDSLGENGIDIDLIPVPKEIHSNCGMAVGLSKLNVREAVRLIKIHYRGDMQLFEYKRGTYKRLRLDADV